MVAYIKRSVHTGAGAGHTGANSKAETHKLL